jgi:GNAT superfamily N-acetyltransferase
MSESIIYRFLEVADSHNSNVRSDIDLLLKRLAGPQASLSLDDFVVVAHKSVWRVADEESSGAIVGMVIMSLNHLPSGSFGQVSDLVVRPDHLGEGIERKLLEDLIALAKSGKKIHCLTAALKVAHYAAPVFKSLGFVRDETGNLRLVLSP